MKTELRILFFSPIAWLILVVFAVQVGLTYYDKLDFYFVAQVSGAQNDTLTYKVFGTLFQEMLDYLYLYVPLLTMGLMSREFGSGSIKLLYSSPVSNVEIIIGKYASMLVFGLGFVAILLVPILSGFFSIENFDIGRECISLLGFYLTFCVYAAIGLFLSTITMYQVVAAIGTLVVLALLSYVGKIGQEIDFVRDITNWLSVTGKTKGLLKGIIGTSDVAYYLLVIGMFLSLCVLKLRGNRLNSSSRQQSLRYGLLVVIVLLCGYVTSRPAFDVYYDATKMKLNTLSETNRNLLKQLPGELKLVTYVNYLDFRNYLGMPKNRIEDMERFDMYRHCKPEMKMEYVYYYHHPGELATYSYHTGFCEDLPDKERMERLAEVDDLNPSMFIPVEDLPADLDVKREDYRFFRRFEYENGKKATLRVFDDMRVHPSEMEVASALKTLLEPSPVIAFTTGHRERSPYNMGEAGYGSYLTAPNVRWSMINKGFTVETIELSEAISDSVDVLVLADLRTALSSEELKNLENYIDRGGNLLLITEDGKQEVANPVAELLGLKFEKGLLERIDGKEEGYAEATLTDEITKQISGWDFWKKQHPRVVMDAPVSIISDSDSKGFGYVDALVVIDTYKQNAPVSESDKKVVAKYASRMINGKEQRIFALGDAECLTERMATRYRHNGVLFPDVLEFLSYNRFPVVAVSHAPTDNRVLLDLSGMDKLRIVCVWIVPLLIVFGFIMMYVKRRNR